MSSTYQTHAASNCIDGDPSTFCHTTAENFPWLSAQLSSPSSAVSYVLLYNRVDCCQDRLSPFQLWVGATAGDFNSATSASCGVDEVNLTVPATQGQGPFSFRCSDNSGIPLVGSYVTLVLVGTDRILNIGEIQAFGPSPPPPPAVPGGSYGATVSSALTLNSTVEDFNSTSFTTGLLEEYPDATDVTINVTGGSIVVEYQLTFPSTESAHTAATTLADDSPSRKAALSARLGVSVESIDISKTIVKEKMITRPMPPMPSRPPAPPDLASSGPWGPFSPGMVGVLVATNPTSGQFSVGLNEVSYFPEGDQWNIWHTQFQGPVAVSNGIELQLGSNQHITIPSLPPPPGATSGLHINCGTW